MFLIITQLPFLYNVLTISVFPLIFLSSLQLQTVFPPNYYLFLHLFFNSTFNNSIPPLKFTLSTLLLLMYYMFLYTIYLFLYVFYIHAILLFIYIYFLLFIEITCPRCSSRHINLSSALQFSFPLLLLLLHLSPFCIT